MKFSMNKSSCVIRCLTAGFANYRDYAFKLYKRFDYTPEDCYRFHEAVAAGGSPVSYSEQRRDDASGATASQDTVDPKGRPTLRHSVRISFVWGGTDIK